MIDRIEELDLVVGVLDFELEGCFIQLGADQQLAIVAQALTSDHDCSDPRLFAKAYEWWKTIVGGRLMQQLTRLLMLLRLLLLLLILSFLG